MKNLKECPRVFQNPVETHRIQWNLMESDRTLQKVIEQAWKEYPGIPENMTECEKIWLNNTE